MCGISWWLWWCVEWACAHFGRREMAQDKGTAEEVLLLPDRPGPPSLNFLRETALLRIIHVYIGLTCHLSPPPPPTFICIPATTNTTAISVSIGRHFEGTIWGQRKLLAHHNRNRLSTLMVPQIYRDWEIETVKGEGKGT